MFEGTLINAGFVAVPGNQQSSVPEYLAQLSKKVYKGKRLTGNPRSLITADPNLLYGGDIGALVLFHAAHPVPHLQLSIPKFHALALSIILN